MWPMLSRFLCAARAFEVHLFIHTSPQYHNTPPTHTYLNEQIYRALPQPQNTQSTPHKRRSPNIPDAGFMVRSVDLGGNLISMLKYTKDKKYNFPWTQFCA